MNGGTVQAITGNGLNTSNLNVTGNFTPTFAITNVGTINVNAGGNFTVNPGLEPTGFTGFTVAAGGNLNLNTNFTVPDGATLTNAGTFAMNGFNLLMGTGSTFNSNSNLTTSGSIQRASPATGYTLNVGGGTLSVDNPISGYTTFNVNTATAELNNGGSLSSVALNNGTFTIKGGTITGDIIQTAPASILNINTAFTAPATINVDTLNVNNGGTFTPNATVRANVALNINQGGDIIVYKQYCGAGRCYQRGYNNTYDKSSTYY